eukprot:scaffold301_cov243-Pinguiococcus_pyrenoidosus.AAC.24
MEAATRHKAESVIRQESHLHHRFPNNSDGNNNNNKKQQQQQQQQQPQQQHKEVSCSTSLLLRRHRGERPEASGLPLLGDGRQKVVKHVAAALPLDEAGLLRGLYPAKPLDDWRQQIVADDAAVLPLLQGLLEHLRIFQPFLLLDLLPEEPVPGVAVLAEEAERLHASRHDLGQRHEERRHDEVDEVEAQLRLEGIVPVASRRHGQALRLLEVPLREELLHHAVAPLLRHVPAPAGVANVCDVAERLHEDLAILRTGEELVPHAREARLLLRIVQRVVLLRIFLCVANDAAVQFVLQVEVHRHLRGENRTDDQLPDAVAVLFV